MFEALKSDVLHKYVAISGDAVDACLHVFGDCHFCRLSVTFIRDGRFGNTIDIFYGPDSGIGNVEIAIVFQILRFAPRRFFHGKRYDGGTIDWSVVVPKGSVGLSGSYLFRSCSIYVQRFFLGGCDHECGFAVDNIDYRRRILRIPVSNHAVYIDIRSQQIDFFRRIGAKSSLIRNNGFGDIVGGCSSEAIPSLA